MPSASLLPGRRTKPTPFMASLLTSPGHRMHKVSSCQLPIRGEDHGPLLPVSIAPCGARA